MDVQGGCGVHGVASLCGEELGEYQPAVDFCQLLGLTSSGALMSD